MTPLTETVAKKPEDLTAFATYLFDRLKLEASNFFHLRTLTQIAIIALCFAAAHLMAKILVPLLEARLRGIRNQPRLLRLLIVPLRRLKWILFALLLWITALVMREITWPSASYYIWVTASLASAWVIISIASRFIHNRRNARVIAAIAWTVAALNILGLLVPILNALDKVAFDAGTSRFSLLLAIKALLVVALFVWIANIVSDFLEQRIKHDLEVSPAVQVLMGKLMKGAMIAVAIVAGLSTVGVDLTALAVFSGALGLGIGFGLQKLASNLLSGIIILADRSIKPGDVITVGETFGWISSLNARYVSVVTRDGLEYLIPNEFFVTERVINWSYSDDSVRLEVKFGVSYDSDPYEVRRVVIAATSNVEGVLSYRPPVCHLVAFGDSSIDFVLRFWIQDPRTGLTNKRGEVMLALWDALKNNGIQIPYPHREVIMRTPVTVEGVGKAQPPRANRKKAAQDTVAAADKPADLT